MKKGVVSLLVLLSATLAFGLQVDKDELTKGQGSNIVFINYVGPHTTIDTLEQIVGIGQSLGRGLGTASTELAFNGKYRLIHAVGAPEGQKLDADIFIIEPAAEVDDVINIMRMVGGYLQAAYSYSPADAMVLARFVLYYNAVFRGDLKYFGGIYKTIVMNNVSADNAGIATKYTDWPGKTRMLIPLLGTEKGNLNNVGAAQLASPKVVENLQQQPGKALPERKELTELQQRGLEQGQQKLQQQQAQLQQQKQELGTQQQQLAKTQQEAAQAQAAASAPGATPEQQQKAAQKQAEVQQQQQAVQSQEQKVQQQQQAVAQQQQQQAANQTSVQQQRAGIAADEQALIQQKQQAAAQPQQPASQPQTTPASTQAPGQVLFVYDLGESPDHLGKLVLIDRVSGKLLTQSDLNSVRGRTYVTVGKAIVVTAGRTGGNAAVRLVSVDPASLSVQQQGKDNLVPSSFLAASEGSVYAVIDSGHGAFLGRFDQSLALQAQSERAVDPFTYIVVSGTEVFVQDGQGNILILDKNDLKEKKRAAGQPPT
ncbi:MAG TPA: P83/100 family protein [Spirochaetia bacterium]|nr:P83/100 family protein [Spirochaetia bacterium]